MTSDAQVIERNGSQAGEARTTPDLPGAIASFTLDGLRRGFRLSLPFAFGTLAFGITFGAIAQGSGVDGVAPLVMSLVVYSGTAQMLALQLMDGHASLFMIWAGTLLVSLRYVLLGVTMRGWFHGLPRWLVYPNLYATADQSWALMLGEVHAGRRDAGFFLGSNLALFLGWTCGTAIGTLAGDRMGDPTAWGLQFAAPAAFIGILAGMHRGRRDLLPWLTAGLVAVMVERLVDGYWYLGTAVLAGCLVGLLQGESRDG